MEKLVYLLLATHFTIMCVTLYLHRGLAHRSCEFHPYVALVMRCWLWLTTGMISKQWVAIHRMHHHKTDTPEDPHSPQTYGIWRVLFGGAFLYHKATKDGYNIQLYGNGCPNDWFERKLFSKYHLAGIFILLLALCWIWGWHGIWMWVIQMIWIPFWAAGVVNGIGHWWGYRNVKLDNSSRNIIPLGLIIGGEELHQNHHARIGSAKLSHKWWEFDIGWLWLCLLERCKLATIRQK